MEKLKVGDVCRLDETGATYPYEVNSLYSIHEITNRGVIGYMVKGNGLVAEKVKIYVNPSCLHKV